MDVSPKSKRRHHVVREIPNMSVEASCPQCSATSSVPEEMLGKKVRCKRCRTKFIVAEDAGEAPLLTRNRALLLSGGMRRSKRSHRAMWIAMSAAIFILIGIGGAAFWVAM